MGYPTDIDVVGFLFNVNNISVNATDEDYQVLVELERRVHLYVRERFSNLAFAKSHGSGSFEPEFELLNESWTEDFEGAAMVGIFVGGSTSNQPALNQITVLFEEAVSSCLNGTPHVLTGCIVKYFREPKQDKVPQDHDMAVPR